MGSCCMFSRYFWQDRAAILSSSVPELLLLLKREFSKANEEQFIKRISGERLGRQIVIIIQMNPGHQAACWHLLKGSGAATVGCSELIRWCRDSLGGHRGGTQCPVARLPPLSAPSAAPRGHRPGFSSCLTWFNPRLARSRSQPDASRAVHLISPACDAHLYLSGGLALVLGH